ncbi:MAG: thioredoxin family protein [Ilumatobacter sp.]
MSRTVRVLHVLDCPNAAVAIERIREAVGEDDARVDELLVRTDDEAARLGMRGSPTILVDGVDHFTPPGCPTGVACRIAPGGDPVPSVQALRAAFASSG